MGVNRDALIIPGHGTLFTGPKNTVLPDDPLSAFTLNGKPPTGWDNVGHTSKDNAPEFKRDGGEATMENSWLEDGVKAIYSAVAWKFGAKLIQVDASTLDLSFGGRFDERDGGYIVPNSSTGIEKAIFLLGVDGTGRIGFYLPNTSINLEDAPSMDAGKFLEFPILASILPAPESIIPSVNGRPGIMKVFKTGLLAAAPRVTATIPPKVAAGSQVTITGTGLTGTESVKFGSVDAASFLVVNDNNIVAIVPAGSAGSAPITVKCPAGSSAAFPYTRA